MSTSTFNVNRAPTTAAYYRPNSYIAQSSTARPPPNVRDDYERWYTEAGPNNRMLLALRSGIQEEIGWALDRLCRLCDNELFILSAIPGLTSALLEWPEWYAKGGYKEKSEVQSLFAPTPYYERKRRHALESLIVLRNTSMNEANAWEVANHPRIQPLILTALNNLDIDLDETAEFLLYILNLMHSAGKWVLPPRPIPPQRNPLPALQKIVSQSQNRSMIIAAFNGLTLIFSNPPNLAHLDADSPALEAAIRFLPLFVDKPLVDVCLNYLYIHLSHPAMSKAFLLRPEMPSTLKLLVSLLLHEQVEETVTVDVGGETAFSSSYRNANRDHELTKEELDELLEKPEPQRCYEWMKTMFVAKPQGELTQVDFWNLYKDVFMPFQDRFPLLVASDVIKNVNVVFPQAQAMVLPGPPQKFVVRGVDRRKEDVVQEEFKCKWDRAQCASPVFDSPQQLYEHLLEHINSSDSLEFPCLWSTCSKSVTPKTILRAHILTHLPSGKSREKPDSQSDIIASSNAPHPLDAPTTRPPPPPPRMAFSYRKPLIDPPSTSLTALLCIRILFRASFASSDAAPRVDADHFGFPGIVEDTDDQDVFEIDGGDKDSEQEGEKRGRKAFIGVERLLESVRLSDEALMGWVTEMVDAGYSGPL